MSVWRHRSRRIRVLPLALLMACCALPASAQDPQRSNAAALPSFSELRSGWNLLRPGGDTICAQGGEYAFSVRPGARDKLLIWLEGGGACWNAGTAPRLALRLFNNRPGTTAADVIRLLEEARDRIRADLSRKAK